jgi:hypothetical protein
MVLVSPASLGLLTFTRLAKLLGILSCISLLSSMASGAFLACFAMKRHRWVEAPRNSHRFCFVSRFGLAAIIGAARLTPARMVLAQAPRWS